MIALKRVGFPQDNHFIAVIFLGDYDVGEFFGYLFKVRFWVGGEYAIIAYPSSAHIHSTVIEGQVGDIDQSAVYWPYSHLKLTITANPKLAFG
jgi:hypothetical protein